MLSSGRATRRKASCVVRILVSGRWPETCPPRFNDGEPARQVVEDLRVLEEGVNQVKDGRSRGGAGQINHHDARVLVRRVIADIGEVEIPRQDCQLLSLSKGRDVLVRRTTQADVAHISRKVAPRTNQRS